MKRITIYATVADDVELPEDFEANVEARLDEVHCFDGPVELKVLNVEIEDD